MGLIASLIAVVPLGLVLMTSVAFAVGGVRLANHNVLIQELAAVEGLARVDVLCMDKTGTLTEGGLVFDAVHPLAPEPGWEQVLAWFGAEPEANATARCLSTVFEDDGGLQPVSPYRSPPPGSGAVSASTAAPARPAPGFSGRRRWCSCRTTAPPGVSRCRSLHRGRRPAPRP